MSQLCDFIIFLEDSENNILQPLFASFINHLKNMIERILGHINNKSSVFM